MGFRVQGSGLIGLGFNAETQAKGVEGLGFRAPRGSWSINTTPKNGAYRLGFRGLV